jgi:hypothetical protein
MGRMSRSSRLGERVGEDGMGWDGMGCCEEMSPWEAPFG